MGKENTDGRGEGRMESEKRRVKGWCDRRDKSEWERKETERSARVEISLRVANDPDGRATAATTTTRWCTLPRSIWRFLCSCVTLHSYRNGGEPRVFVDYTCSSNCKRSCTAIPEHKDACTVNFCQAYRSDLNDTASEEVTTLISGYC